MHAYKWEQYRIETIGLVLVTLSLFGWFVSPLWKSLFFSMLLSIFFKPILYDRIAGWLGSGKAAAFVAFVALAVPIIPIAFMVYYGVYFADLLVEALSDPSSAPRVFADDLLVRAMEHVPGLAAYINIESPSELLSEDGIIGRNFGSITNVTQGILGTVYSSALSVMFWIAVIMFGVYYQLKAGDRPMRFARSVLPVRPEFVDHMFHEFAQMSRAMVKVTLIIGTIQGGIGGIVLWMLGTPYAFLWTFMMIVFSMIPVLGAGLILFPTALIYMFAVGDMFAGLVVFGTFLFVGVIDNILKPRIVGSDMEMDPGLILLGVVGGMISFGAIGAFAGPIMIAFCKAYYDVYLQMHEGHHEVNGQKQTEWRPISLHARETNIPPVRRNRPIRRK